MPIGFIKGLSFDHQRTNWNGDGPRPLKWAAWYPAADDASAQPSSTPSWFQKEPVARDAALKSATAPFPLVLLSHGTGGSTEGLNWLAYRLVRRGFVALAVNHHGNTGAEPYRAEGFLSLWERARDLTALLDDDGWRQRLAGTFDAHAHVAGFSAGAYAAMLLMGARVAYSQFEPDNPVKSTIRGPREFPNLADKIPLLLEKSSAFRDSWERRSDSYADERVQSALVLAPGRSVLGFSLPSLQAIEKPIRIVVGDDDRIAPATECSGWLHDRLRRSELEVLTGGAGHYVFLPEPTSIGRRGAPDIFADAPTVNRRSVHDHVALSAADLFSAVRRFPSD